MKWKLRKCLTDANQIEITGMRWELIDDGGPLLTRDYMSFKHEDDQIVIGGAAYTRDTPVWEERMREWFKSQNQCLKNFSTVDEYLAYVKTVIALEN
jgi:hypothetical protein